MADRYCSALQLRTINFASLVILVRTNIPRFVNFFLKLWTIWIGSSTISLPAKLQKNKLVQLQAFWHIYDIHVSYIYHYGHCNEIQKSMKAFQTYILWTVDLKQILSVPCSCLIKLNTILNSFKLITMKVLSQGYL